MPREKAAPCEQKYAFCMSAEVGSVFTSVNFTSSVKGAIGCTVVLSLLQIGVRWHRGWGLERENTVRAPA